MAETRFSDTYITFHSEGTTLKSSSTASRATDGFVQKVLEDLRKRTAKPLEDRNSVDLTLALGEAAGDYYASGLLLFRLEVHGWGLTPETACGFRVVFRYDEEVPL